MTWSRLKELSGWAEVLHYGCLITGTQQTLVVVERRARRIPTHGLHLQATHASTTVLWYEHGSRWHQVMIWPGCKAATLKLKSRRRWHLNNQ